MCGRFTLTTPGSILAESFGVPELVDLDPRYNIAPTQPVACLRPASRRGDDGAGRRGDGGGRGDDGAGRRGDGTGPDVELAMLRWGLVPHWADDPSIGNRLINARSETVADKPAFRDAFRNRRCLVIADGFYEWKRIDGRKQPYYVRNSTGRPFAFAGLWERWRPRAGGRRTEIEGAGGAAGGGGADDRGEAAYGNEAVDGNEAAEGNEGAEGNEAAEGGGTATGNGAIESCTVLTVPANALVVDIHDRMPAILSRERYEEWLDPARSRDDGAALRELLSPYAAGEMEAYPVSTFVNAPANDAPQCIEPLYAERSADGSIGGGASEASGESEASGAENDARRPRTGRLF